MGKQSTVPMNRRFWLLIFLSLGIFSQPVFADIPSILSISPEETAGAGGRLPAIATDAQNQPHIAADGGSLCYLYVKVGTAWRAAGPV